MTYATVAKIMNNIEIKAGDQKTRIKVIDISIGSLTSARYRFHWTFIDCPSYTHAAYFPSPNASPENTYHLTANNYDCRYTSCIRANMSRQFQSKNLKIAKISRLFQQIQYNIDRHVPSKKIRLSSL